jgi:obg-like ATPase 1
LAWILIATKQQNNIPIRTGEWSAPEIEKINELIPACITTKPIVYLVNLSSDSFVTKKSKWLVRIGHWVKAHGGGTVIPFSVEFEQVLYTKHSLYYYHTFSLCYTVRYIL